MQQFAVPQYITVEDKIFGPVTVRQFIIMLVGFLLCALFYRIFDFTLFLTSAVITIAIFGTFAFLRVNGRPFHFFVLNLIQTFGRPKLRTWDHRIGKDQIQEFNFTIEQEEVKKPRKSFADSRLSELSLIVDTQGRYHGSEGSDQDNILIIK